MEKEIRNVPVEFSEFRSDKNSRRISGLGIVFNRKSNLIDGSFYEVIMPEAVSGVLQKSDIYFLLNHDANRGVLARCKQGVGSLNLSVSNQGVNFNFIAPQTNLGNEFMEGVQRGDIKGSSF